MACDFSVVMNPGSTRHIEMASQALDLVADLEHQLSVYQSDTEVSLLNANAANRSVVVEPKLFQLLRSAKKIHADTQQAFDLTAGPLISLWRECRSENQIPRQEQIDKRLAVVGMELIEFEDGSIKFAKPGMMINLGAIGKGYALDRVAEQLKAKDLNDFLLHGGHSSIYASGDHNATGGWPVGIGNPLFTDRRLGTVLLRDQAMSTSGANIQHFRHRGKRYGHILDPRTGWPAKGALSVTVLAPTAAEADALSTAFYVGGEEVARSYCKANREVTAIIIPAPKNDRRVSPLMINGANDQFFWDREQVLSPTSDE